METLCVGKIITAKRPMTANRYWADRSAASYYGGSDHTGPGLHTGYVAKRLSGCLYHLVLDAVQDVFAVSQHVNI